MRLRYHFSSNRGKNKQLFARFIINLNKDFTILSLSFTISLLQILNQHKMLSHS